MTPATLPEVSTPSATVGRGRLFRIPEGKCICLWMRGTEFVMRKGPNQVREDEIDPKKVPGYLESGVLVQLGDPNPDDPSISGKLVTHDSVRPPGGVGASVPLTDEKTANVRSPQRLKRKSIYNFDPAWLKTKTLDDLNLKLFEVNPSAKPCETIEQAVALLSEDYGA